MRPGIDQELTGKETGKAAIGGSESQGLPPIMNGNRIMAARWPWFDGSRFARNVSWNILGNLGGKLLSPVFQVLIARLLVPEDFGVFAIALAWLAAFDIGKDWGLTQAILVSRGGKAEIRLQFTVQLATTLLFYAATLAVAPLAVWLFELPHLGLVLPLVCLVALIDAVADPIVTECLLTQRYRHLAVRQVLTPLVSGAVGLLLAYQGHGVYSLVVGLLVGHVAGASTLIVGAQVRLTPVLDWIAVRNLMATGKHIVLQRLFGFLVSQVDSFIVGKALGPQALGLYRMGCMLAFLLPAASVPQAQQVTFTELLERRDVENVRSRYNLFANRAGLSLLLYSVAVYLAAPLMIPALLGEHWRDVVPLTQVFAAVVITGFITPMNIDLAKVLGFIGSYTYFAAGRSVATVVAIAWAAQYSAMQVVITWVIVGLISNLVNDLIFYTRQDVVPLTRSKVALTGASWLWAGLVIIGALR